MGVNKRVGLWFFITIFIGFFQLIMDLLQKFIQGKDFDYYGFVGSGAILFFSSGLLASSAFDIWSTKEIKADTFDLNFIIFHIMAPLFCLVLISVIYTSFTAVNAELTSLEHAKKIEKYQTLQILLFGFSLFYGMYSKQYLIKIAIEEMNKKEIK